MHWWTIDLVILNDFEMYRLNRSINCLIDFLVFEVTRKKTSFQCVQTTFILWISNICLSSVYTNDKKLYHGL